MFLVSMTWYSLTMCGWLTCTVQHSKEQYSTVQYGTVQYSTVQLDDVPMAHQFHHLHLAVHLGQVTRVQVSLVDDLDGHLGNGI